jgi:hypothetical protein
MSAFARRPLTAIRSTISTAISSAMSTAMAGGVACVVLALLLAGCDFTSRTPLVSLADAAWPLAPGAYLATTAAGDFGPADTSENPKPATLARETDGYVLSIAEEEAPVQFLLYRASPSVYIMQAQQPSGLWTYGVVKRAGAGAQLYPLSCNQFTRAELARFNASWETQEARPDAQGASEACVFTALDGVVAAAFALLNREMAPALKLSPATP